MTNEKMLKEAPIGKLLLTMSLPVVVAMLVTVLYNMADVFFMGRTGETMQVAAISLAGPVFSAVSTLNTLIGFGSCTAISIALGKNDVRLAKTYSSFAFYASVLLGVAVMIVILFGMQPLLSLLGTDVQTVKFTADYLRILAFGAPFMTVGGAMANTVRADGDSKSAMLATLVGTTVNILLDPLLISVLHWGVKGAAAATVIGNLFSCVILFFVLQKKNIYSLSVRDFSARRSVSFRIIGLGLPMAAGTALTSISSAMANRLLMQHGNLAVAANGVSGKAGMLVSMLLMGICMGMQPAISYAYGARDQKRLRQIVHGTGIAAISTAFLLSVSLFLARESFVAFFLNDDSVISMGKRFVTGALVSMPVCAIYQLCATYLQGTGKISYAMLASLLRQGIVYTPVLLGMHALFGLTGLIYAGAVSDLLSTMTGLMLCIARSGRMFSELDVCAE